MNERPTSSGSRAAPSAWVLTHFHGVAAGGRVLDVACGSGRHVRAARDRGYSVVAVDRDLSGVADLAGDANVTLVEADLEAGPPPFAGRSFDGVIVTNYLWRPLLPHIVAAVAPRGLLLYETFGVGQERLGKPSNPEFLLHPGELLAAVQGHLLPIAYQHATEAEPARIIQRIAAVGREHPWAFSPPPPSS